MPNKTKSKKSSTKEEISYHKKITKMTITKPENVYTMSVKELRKLPDFNEEYYKRCVKTGKIRSQNIEDLNPDFDKYSGSELKQYCTCSINKLNDTTIDKLNPEEVDFNDCIKKVNTSQKKRLSTTTKYSKSKKNKSIKSKNSKGKSSKSKSKNMSGKSSKSKSSK